MSHVRIFDTTLRDGEQSPGFSMNTDEKIRMAHQLAALGVDIIEAGFPIASKGDLEAVMAVSREVRETRSKVGVCDVSTLGKIDIQGADAGPFLDRIYANTFSTVPVGKLRYGLMLREDGIVMDDGTSAR